MSFQSSISRLSKINFWTCLKEPGSCSSPLNSLVCLVLCQNNNAQSKHNTPADQRGLLLRPGIQHFSKHNSIIFLTRIQFVALYDEQNLFCSAILYCVLLFCTLSWREKHWTLLNLLFDFQLPLWPVMIIKILKCLSAFFHLDTITDF